MQIALQELILRKTVLNPYLLILGLASNVPYIWASSMSDFKKVATGEL